MNRSWRSAARPLAGGSAPRPAAIILLGALLAAAPAAAIPSDDREPAALPDGAGTAAQVAAVASPHAAAAARLAEAALNSPQAYDRLGQLCDVFGPRLSGSAELADAIDWALAELRRDGFANVRGEPVMVPHWVRGEEWAWVTAPRRFRLTLLGLGGSVGTPPEGIEADLLVVSSFAELEARAAEAPGRIVLFDQGWEGYGKSVQYRSRGAVEAGRRGAVACLIRSVTGSSLATPHTGVMRYDDDPAVPRIPAAALTVEDAGRLRRLAERGLPVRVHLFMGARTLPDAASANVVAEIPGRELPEEIVVVSGHFDSWDAGTGAHDDAAGCIIAWEAARLLRATGLIPRRTVRLVLYADEEQTQAGGHAYAAAHAAALPRHVAALECDSGAFPPAGFSVQADSTAVAHIRELASALLAPLGASAIGPGGSGVDVSFIVKEGVIGLGHRVDAPRYFDYHHSPADTFDKVDPEALARNVAAVAVIAYLIAEDPELPRPARVAP